MNKTILQIPVDVVLRKNAEKGALEQGFSSLQEAVRIFLANLATKNISATFTNKKEEVVHLSKKAIARYEKMDEEIERGKVKTETFTDVDSLMKHLNK